MLQIFTLPDTGPEAFWGTAIHNVLEIERAEPELVIALAHGGILPARATQVACEVLLDRPFPPLLITNIGSEKRRRYLDYGRRQAEAGFSFEGTFSAADEVVAFLGWLQEQTDWQEELKAQVSGVLGSYQAPASIVVIDEMKSQGNAMLFTIGLLDIIYPQARSYFLDGPYFEWRTTMSRRWITTFHPELLPHFDPSNREIPRERAGAPYRIAAGTEDVDPARLALRPLTADNPHLAELTPFLPADEWMSMPGWITQQVLTHVEQQARQADLAELRTTYAYLLEREGSGIELFQLLAHIRRWGSINDSEARSLLGLSPESVQEMLGWLVDRLEGDARWTDAVPLTQSQTRQGRVYFSQEEQRPEPFEPVARRSKDQKQRDAARRYRRRRRPSAR